MCAITFRMPLSYDSEGRDSESLVQKRETIKLLGGSALGRENGGVLGRRVRAGGVVAGQGFLFPLVVLTRRGVIPFTEGSVGKELVSLRQKRERNYTGKHFFSLDLSLKVWSGRNGDIPRHWAYCLLLFVPGLFGYDLGVGIGCGALAASTFHPRSEGQVCHPVGYGDLSGWWWRGRPSLRVTSACA